MLREREWDFHNFSYIFLKETARYVLNDGFQHYYV
jgi:hypothetical protein